MNAPPMETIFLILSGVVLAAGVLYWFWSHIQLTQKKVQLLENAVFELRGLVSGPSSPSAAASGGSEGGSEPPASIYKDLDDDEDDGAWISTSTATATAATSVMPTLTTTEIGSTPLSALGASSDDLQPGGRLEVPHEAVEQDAPTTDEQFRELFVQRETSLSATSPPKREASTAAPAATGESLDTMPVKDLRRLAEQRGLTGVSEMRKKELLAALRQQITSVPSSSASGTVTVERTLDLTEAGEIEEATVLE